MNEMHLKILSRSENEVFVRNAVAAFVLPLNPSLSELSDVKTAVSEAVTNCIVHGYRGSEGWIDIVCRTEGNRLHIEITDSGSGIPEQELLHIFERFYRGSEFSKNGYGIGLSFAQKIISSQNGSIQVRNAKPHGAEFEIRMYKTVV